MTIENPYINSGVEGGTGYEFQKNCLIFILLDEYDNFRDKEYFICMESADDFIICFLENNELKEVRTYQAKKNSNGSWTTSNMTKEIIPKMCEGGVMIQEDNSLPHAKSYTQKLHFLSNQIIKLEKKICNEASEIVEYDDLEEKTKKMIEKSISDFHTKENKEYDVNKILDQRKFLIFRFLDLNRTIEEQQNCLKGKIDEVFKSEVPNTQAALETILHCLTISSTTYNKNKQLKLYQKNKWVTSKSIQDCFGTITTKSKFFDRWRTRIKEICQSFNIPLKNRSMFRSTCENSFEYFKDPNQIEHQKILTMATEMINTSNACTEEDFVNELWDFNESNLFSSFPELEFKAIAYAAAIQLLNN
ncbi:MAG: DUF4297 domain-containing protein [Paludibacteraceae bacterium]|nr:DUF4297 domain-containing protein [Paludibacteraceae bacterium]